MTPTPGQAALLTFLVPGLSHFLLGRAVRGAVALLTTVGLFWTGYAIVADRIWFCELFAPSGFFGPILRHVPLQLLPEAPNLGSTVVASFLREFDSLTATRLLRLPREMEHLGLFLTGVSGVLACLWAADAHYLAQGRRPAGVQPGTAALLSWFVPGSGHWLAGQRDKGALMGAAVVVMFAAGLWFAHGHAVDRPLMSAWWIGQSLFGGGTLFAALVTGPLQFEPTVIPRFQDLGVALCTVAGFMNLIVMIDAYSVAEDLPVGAGGAAGSRRAEAIA